LIFVADRGIQASRASQTKRSIGKKQKRREARRGGGKRRRGKSSIQNSVSAKGKRLTASCKTAKKGNLSFSKKRNKGNAIGA